MEALEPETVEQLIFRPGFSTRKDASELSGRGVGLDVVSTQVRRLGGTVAVKSASGQGTQIRLRSLPALWTDFPFAVWAEEWGFLGCLVVLIAYAALILWALKIAREARDRFGAAVCVGCAAMLFWQVAINIGMVTGVLPVMGVTLPLISYGGSSLITVMVAMGLVMNVSVRRFAY